MEKTVDRIVRVCDVCEEKESDDKCMSCGKDICAEDNWTRKHGILVKYSGGPAGPEHFAALIPALAPGRFSCSVDLCPACGPSMNLEALAALITEKPTRS